MAKNNNAYGTLFTQDYLEIGIRDDPDWDEVSPEELAEKLRPIYEEFPIASNPNESTTEDKLIWPILEALGWTSYLRQQNLEDSRRSLRPDGLLFTDKEALEQANSHQEEWRRYKFGVALVESKRWRAGRGMDINAEPMNGGAAAATQMLYYLRRAIVRSDGSLEWGILTDGMVWRLYWQGARSVAEQYFQINLAPLLGFDYDGSTNATRFPEEEADNMRLLKIFGLVFRRVAFVPSTSSLTTFHQRALDAGKFYETRVSKNLSDKIFTTVFPELAKAILQAEPETSLDEVRDATLTLMYRLLFLFFAEDRKFLPVNDSRYVDYGLREKVRMDIKERMESNDVFSKSVGKYWSAVDELSKIVNEGDPSIGLPPYNGGLFDREQVPLLSKVKIPDDVLANVIDVLSFDKVKDERRYINYMDLSVQHLGSIYERLLEYELYNDKENGLVLRPNMYAKKSSGSYYTPDNLIQLVISETLDPIIQECKREFMQALDSMPNGAIDDSDIRTLRSVDPARKMLKIKVCDPAMGSGPFLVQFVDYLADQIVTAMAEAQNLANKGEVKRYCSPLFPFIEETAIQIQENAKKHKWTMAAEQVNDYRVVRRMILKRCVYGVDKNEMAVELAKVSLWLHSFTVGAPLSFIDHHLRCGDSLYGEWVEKSLERLSHHGLFIGDALNEASGRAEEMRLIDQANDLDIVETTNSANRFKDVLKYTRPLNTIMHVVQALRWMNLRDNGDKAVMNMWLDGQFGDPIRVLMEEVLQQARGEYSGSSLGENELQSMKKKQSNVIDEKKRFRQLLEEVFELTEREKFLNWEVAYPGVWDDWEKGRTGGFDAVIGNPPWDRIKFQQVEWLASRYPNVAKVANASRRKKLMKENEEIAKAWEMANTRSGAMARVAREGGSYPLLSGRDINLYSLFVERSMSLLNDGGMLGLLTPSGIASDKTSAKFFKKVVMENRLMALYDFTNRNKFFPDVTSQFKFCAFIASRSKKFRSAKCAFFLSDTKGAVLENKTMMLSASDFNRFNPNTGTAPVFNSRRDMEITAAIYGRLPVLTKRVGNRVVRAWPVKHYCMFHMTNDSEKFRTAVQLKEEEGAWQINGNVWQNAEGMWLPLYVGKMFHQYDHRAASVDVNRESVHNPAVSKRIDSSVKVDTRYAPTPQYWVRESEVCVQDNLSWFLAFRDIARVTDSRTMIASAIPRSPTNNTVPLMIPHSEGQECKDLYLLLGNLNSLVFDYVVRQKVHSTHLNWFIVEQLPVVPQSLYEKMCFGAKTAKDVVKEAVLELTYTAHDMASFAEELGYVDNRGKVREPYTWNDERRTRLRAKLDAVYFHLYGVYSNKNIGQSRDDITYIYSTFPIFEKKEMREYGYYKSRDLALAYCSALAAGEPDAEPIVGPNG